MKKLTPEEKNKIIDKLKEDFDTDEVEFHGYNRFVVREKYSQTIEKNEVFLFKDRLFDEECNPITFNSEYDSIFMFIVGVAVVCIRRNIEIINGRIHQERKDGMIDINGKELLPCIYDKIKVKLDGHVELTKDGHKKATSVFVITNGKFNWDEAIDWN